MDLSWIMNWMNYPTACVSLMTKMWCECCNVGVPGHEAHSEVVSQCNSKRTKTLREIKLHTKICAVWVKRKDWKVQFSVWTCWQSEEKSGLGARSVLMLSPEYLVCDRFAESVLNLPNCWQTHQGRHVWYLVFKIWMITFRAEPH